MSLGAPLGASCVASEEHGQRWEEKLLDAYLDRVLAPPEGVMHNCVNNLSGVLGRIVDAPADPCVRRLRWANERSQSEVGVHEAAVYLLRLAGFEDCVCSEDPALAFRGEPGEPCLFHLTHEALKGIVKHLGIDDAGEPPPSLPRFHVPDTLPIKSPGVLPLASFASGSAPRAISSCTMSGMPYS